MSGHSHPMLPRWDLSMGSPKIVQNSRIHNALYIQFFFLLSVGAFDGHTSDAGLPNCDS